MRVNGHRTIWHFGLIIILGTAFVSCRDPDQKRRVWVQDGVEMVVDPAVPQGTTIVNEACVRSAESEGGAATIEGKILAAFSLRGGVGVSTIAANLGVALALASWFALKLRSRKAMLGLSFCSMLYFGFYREGCICAIGAPQNSHNSLPFSFSISS